jgi:hypothetical protein
LATLAPASNAVAAAVAIINRLMSELLRFKFSCSMSLNIASDNGSRAHTFLAPH